MPWARTRSFEGSQMVKIFVTFGKHPASPTPNRNRHTTIDTKFQAAPVAAVNSDHITTTFINTLRGPNRSPIQPPGISNSAYEIVNAEKTQPIWVSSKPRSRRMFPAAWEMQTRSMYVMIASTTTKPRTTCRARVGGMASGTEAGVLAPGDAAE
jgi:hypothetical protein